ncbi:MAG: S-layer homology domain-containing protein, partial [Clostridiales bacterium]|nr:S-layer homology domain-containing protein [Clostridiales bacterium]
IKSGNNIITFHYNYTVEPSGQQSRFSVSAKIKDVLETEEHIPYITGYPNGSVHPDDKITRAEVAIIFWRLLKATAKNEPLASSFSDIKGDEIHAQAVNYLAGVDIIKGYADGSFRPSQSITRAEFTAIASRFDDLLAGEGNPFTDLPGDHWAYDYIVSAYTKGWINGYPGGEFRPQDSISRAEAVKTVNCILGRGIQAADLPKDLPSYTDLTSSHWAYCEIMEASVMHECERKADGWENWKSKQEEQARRTSNR